MTPTGYPTTIPEIEALLAKPLDPKFREVLKRDLAELREEIAKAKKSAARARERARAKEKALRALEAGRPVRQPRKPPQQLAFDHAPRIGFVALSRGQPFTLEEARPYRRNGRNTQVLKWRSTCAECGAPFTQTTPLSGSPYPARRCKQHKRPGIRVQWSDRGKVWAA